MSDALVEKNDASVMSMIGMSEDLRYLYSTQTGMKRTK
ncbi:hypothetical protein AmDm5_1684 [Acetobacter malorum]|nr:hypothetical protein AmDm5_1684 [Acetobacter malorum]